MKKLMIIAAFLTFGAGMQASQAADSGQNSGSNLGISNPEVAAIARKIFFGDTQKVRRAQLQFQEMDNLKREEILTLLWNIQHEEITTSVRTKLTDFIKLECSELRSTFRITETK